MAISKMLAEKMNLDLRDLILEALEGIYFIEKPSKKMQEEGNVCFERVKEGLKELANRDVMLDSLYQFYGIDLDLSVALKAYIKQINDKQYKEAEGNLSQLLFKLEDEYDGGLLSLSKK